MANSKMKDIESEFLGTNVPDKQRSTRKKTINAKKKGNRGELDAVNILKERFKGQIFSRTMGSGNYTGGQNAKNAELLTEEQKLMFVSDIRTPKEFKFSIEHKFYASIDFYDLFNKSSDLHKWYEQAETDAKLLDRSPMLVVKTNQHKRIVFVKMDYLIRNPYIDNNKIVFIHEGWACLWFEDLLTAPDCFFFKG